MHPQSTSFVLGLSLSRDGRCHPRYQRAISDWSLLRREPSSRSPSGRRRAPRRPDLRHLLGPTVAPVCTLGQPEPPALIRMSHLRGDGVPLPEHTPDPEDGGCSHHTEVLPARPKAAASSACCGNSHHTADRAEPRFGDPPVRVGGAEAGGGARYPSPDFRPLSSV